MIDPVIGWFKIMELNDKFSITIVNLVESTCLTRHTCPIEIMYGEISEFIGHELVKSLIE